MRLLLALALVTAFTVLGLWHVYWAFGGKSFITNAIPEVGGRPAFAPGRLLTALVGAFLMLCAGLVAALSALVPIGDARAVLPWFGYALAAVLLARAVGDFNLVGFFKRKRGSRFARLDSLLYSPSCLLLAAGVFAVAAWGPIP